jgi:hypothetical protein
MHRFLLVVLSLGFWILAGCREQSSFRGPFDAGLVCGDKERLVQGTCRFVCERDPDCAQGERCNLLVGVCEPAAPAPDASVDLPCTTGAVRCSPENKAIERCDANGLWETQETCPGEGYCVNEQCRACQPGVATCTAAKTQQVNVCKPDGSGTRTYLCTGSSICSQGECRECAPNTTRCSPDGKSVQICQRSGSESEQWKWANNGDGFDGQCITQVCENVGSNISRCKPADCFPRTTQCKDSKTQQTCNDTGAWTDTNCTTQPGMTSLAECLSGVCIDECADAVRAKSYFGCDYWTAISDNSVDGFFKGKPPAGGQGTADSIFAFVVSNRSEQPTVVEVWRHLNGAPVLVKSVTVEGRNSTSKGLSTIYVPWQSIGSNVGVYLSTTGLKRFGYRIKSTRPVTVYQFNPLDAVKSGKTCTGTEGQDDTSCNELVSTNLLFGPFGACKTAPGTTQKRCHYFTYSNDASLLLPAHILGTSYVAMSPEHLATADKETTAPTGGFGAHLVVVGTQDGTTVTIKSSARTSAGGTVAAIEKGASATITLNSYDVLQLGTTDLGTNYIECGDDPYDANIFGSKKKICRVDNDFTGTVITSDKPVATFGGSACTIKPHTKAACDHVEEQLLPFNTWGKEFVAQQSHPLQLTGGGFASTTQAAPDYWKIVAGCPAATCPNGTLITLSTPPAAADVLLPNRCATGSLATNDCRLMGTQFMEFKSKASFKITADQPILVGQFFAGQGATSGLSAEGDPSFVILPPVEQWRGNYTVLSAPAIKNNYLGLVYDESKVNSVLVDGIAVTGAALLSGTPFRVKNHPVAQGTHTIQVVPKPGLSTFPGVGVTSYGFDSYVSYGYTGGLDLSTLVTGITPGG